MQAITIIATVVMGAAIKKAGKEKLHPIEDMPEIVMPSSEGPSPHQ